MKCPIVSAEAASRQSAGQFARPHESITDSVVLLQPRLEGGRSLFMHGLLPRNGAFASGSGEFRADDPVVKPGCRGILASGSIVNAVQARPVDCRQAHRA